MNPNEIWHSLDCKLVAILRGIKPAETEDIVGSLLDEGFRAIEIPLNSPNAFQSIELAAKLAQQHDSCLIGAGTVLSIKDVQRVKDSGGNLIVSPNIQMPVVTSALELKMACLPGVFTASEAHQAVSIGATGLKFFPASALGASGIKAIAATLPAGVQLCAVGGVGVDDFSNYLKAGIRGFGVGSNLYQPGMAADEVRLQARAMVAAMRQAT